MALPTFDVGGTRLTRVPYFDIALGPEVAGLTGAEVAAIPWAVPVWADDDQQVIVGQAVWVIEAGDRVLVVDPCGAADTFLRSGADAVTHQDAVGAALTAAGFAPDRVDAVILSHLDGIGMAAAVDADGAWTPFFRRARIVVSAAELERVRAHPGIQGAAALLALVAQGAVDAVGARHEPAPRVEMVVTGGHTAGHAVVRITDEGRVGAVFIGHLAVSPLDFAVETKATAHEDVATAAPLVEAELRGAAADQRLLIGPLWPVPGAARVSGPPWVLAPASTER
jgi:glyoxylase-like metal-dependent hydrolase (beta-lactamase superfamily II)